MTGTELGTARKDQMRRQAMKVCYPCDSRGDLCKLPRREQLDQFIRHSEERAINKVIRRSIPQPREKKASLDVVAVVDALQHEAAHRPGSVAVRVGRDKRTVILIGEELSMLVSDTKF